MWQTARPAPTMIPVVRRRASVVFSLDGLCTRAMISSPQAAKGQRVAARARDLSTQNRIQAKVRAVVAFVERACGCG